MSPRNVSGDRPKNEYIASEELDTRDPEKFMATMTASIMRSVTASMSGRASKIAERSFPKHSMKRAVKNLTKLKNATGRRREWGWG